MCPAVPAVTHHADHEMCCAKYNQNRSTNSGQEKELNIELSISSDGSTAAGETNTWSAIRIKRGTVEQRVAIIGSD